jgi:hypothetical protein
MATCSVSIRCVRDRDAAFASAAIIFPTNSAEITTSGLDVFRKRANPKTSLTGLCVPSATTCTFSYSKLRNGPLSVQRTRSTAKRRSANAFASVTITRSAPPPPRLGKNRATRVGSSEPSVCSALPTEVRFFCKPSVLRGSGFAPDADVLCAKR